MVRPKKRTVVTVVKQKHDGQQRVQQAYHQLWRWVVKAQKEPKSEPTQIKE